MLVHGYTPCKTALLLRLPYDLVKGLYDNSWNPRCRKISNTSQYATKRMARMYYESGAMLAKICADLQLPLFTVVTLLKREGITEKKWHLECRISMIRCLWPIVKQSPENRRTRSGVHHACTTNIPDGES